MYATHPQHAATGERLHKVTMAFPADLHAAARDLARANRRSFTAETCVALDEHLARAAAAADTTTTTTTTEKEIHA